MFSNSSFKGLILVLLLITPCYMAIKSRSSTFFTVEQMMEQAIADGIAYENVAFVASAVEEILAVLNAPAIPITISPNATRIDTHVHFIPDWYRALTPFTGGEETPQWNVSDALSFMASNNISHSILSMSAPGANVCFNNTSPSCPSNDLIASTVVARLSNLYAAAVVFRYPHQFSFYTTVPLPYTTQAITEAAFGLDVLGAAGIIGLSNHESLYIGDLSFAPFFNYLNNRSDHDEIIFVHPTTPCVKVGGKFFNANPTNVTTGIDEFFFEDARAFMSLTVSETLHNFTNLKWIAAHSGGSFISILDRFVGQFPNIQRTAVADIVARVWWDSAGPSYPHQAFALTAFNVSLSHLVFGTDFPYAPAISIPFAINGVVNTPWLTSAQKEALFSTNAEALFAGKINFFS